LYGEVAAQGVGRGGAADDAPGDVVDGHLGGEEAQAGVLELDHEAAGQRRRVEAEDVDVGARGQVGVYADGEDAVGVGEEGQLRGGRQGVVAGRTLVGVGLAGAVERLQVGDVGGAQGGARAEVVDVHHGGRVGVVVEAEHVAGLVQGDGEQVIGRRRADAEAGGAVEAHVAGGRAGGGVVGEGEGQYVGGQGGGGDADVAEAWVALGPAGRAEVLAAVADQADVDVGVDGPGLQGAEDLRLPDGGGGVGVEGPEERAGLAWADRGPVGGEADGQMLGVGPGVAPGGRDAAVFELLELEAAVRHGFTSSRGARVGLPAKSRREGLHPLFCNMIARGGRDRGDFLGFSGDPIEERGAGHSGDRRAGPAGVQRKGGLPWQDPDGPGRRFSRASRRGGL
jgi:hypothetical protein